MNNINETLDAIMNIDDCVDESLDSIYEAMYDEYMKMYELSYVTESEYYQESIGSAIKKGVGYIVDMIKKVVDMIVTGIKRVISWITGLLKGKKKKRKNVNNILGEINGNVNEYYVMETSKQSTPKDRCFYIDIDGSVLKCKMTEESRKKYVKMAKSINFYQIGSADLNPFMKQAAGVMAIPYFEHPDLLEGIRDLIGCYSIKNNKVVCDPKIADMYKKFSEKFGEYLQKFQDDSNDDEFTINIDRIQWVNKYVLALQADVNKLYRAKDKSKNEAGYTKSQSSEMGDAINAAMKAVNEGNSRIYLESINAVLLYINGGVNAFANDIKGFYVIDERYHNSINDPTKLDEFIFQMFQSGYPSNVIYSNIKLVVGPKISGKIDNGATRAVIIRPNEYVLKCAINSSGLFSNKSEENLFNTFKKKDKSAMNLLARIIETYPHKCVIKQEFCKDIGKVPVDEIKMLYSKLNARHMSTKTDSVTDRKPDAVGRRVSTNEAVITDYGLISRFSTTQPINGI